MNLTRSQMISWRTCVNLVINGLVRGFDYEIDEEYASNILHNGYLERAWNEVDGDGRAINFLLRPVTFNISPAISLRKFMDDDFKLKYHNYQAGVVFEQEIESLIRSVEAST